jgi:PPM family protein phosphatase
VAENSGVRKGTSSGSSPQKSAAVSHVGKIRSNNQDSGYAGNTLFVVADGMGGHAGGDVASALTIKHIASIDRAFTSAPEAEQALRGALIAANAVLADTVYEHSELTGMGTTVSGLVLVGHEVAIAHIGDSRIYLMRDGDLRQVTADHTFVQRLVDSGRITEEEAAVHPRRSVLMRVLGDVDATPEIDTAVIKTQPGDRWLLCSDGLSSYVSDSTLSAVLVADNDAEEAANTLVKESLDNGAPDNVTVIVVDIDGSGTAAHKPPVTVGAAAGRIAYEGETTKRASVRLPTLLLHPLKATKPDDSHFEPESQEYLDELIVEDARRAQRRRIGLIVSIVLLIAVIAGAVVAGYQWTQTRYFVGVDGSSVAIFRGVQQDVGPFSLSSVYRDTTVSVDDLNYFNRQRVETTISALDLADAERIVSLLEVDAGE